MISQVFLCADHPLPTVPYTVIFDSVSWRQTWSNHDNLWRLARTLACCSIIFVCFCVGNMIRQTFFGHTDCSWLKIMVDFLALFQTQGGGWVLIGLWPLLNASAVAVSLSLEWTSIWLNIVLTNESSNHLHNLTLLLRHPFVRRITVARDNVRFRVMPFLFVQQQKKLTGSYYLSQRPPLVKRLFNEVADRIEKQEAHQFVKPGETRASQLANFQIGFLLLFSVLCE